MLSYSERARLCKSKIAARLLRLMDDKKTNLALSVDVTSSQELLKLADTLGPEICVLKTHIDIINDFSPSLTTSLRELANKHNFLIFEDRKFADIGNTTKLQYEGGIYRISSWADLVNAHGFVGPSVIEGLKEGAVKSETGIILIAELSSKGHLMTEDYVHQTLQMAKEFQEQVIGFITQRSVSDEPQWINFVPGVQMEQKQDSLGQQYNTPEYAISKKSADVIIVGRGIINADDPLAKAKEYRQQGFQAYLAMLKGSSANM